MTHSFARSFYTFKYYVASSGTGISWFFCYLVSGHVLFCKNEVWFELTRMTGLDGLGALYSGFVFSFSLLGYTCIYVMIIDG